MATLPPLVLGTLLWQVLMPQVSSPGAPVLAEGGCTELVCPSERSRTMKTTKSRESNGSITFRIQRKLMPAKNKEIILCCQKLTLGCSCRGSAVYVFSNEPFGRSF